MVGIKIFSFKNTATKLLAGAFVVGLFIVSGYVYSFLLGVGEQTQLDVDAAAACKNLRRLSTKPIDSCETELKREQKILGGFYPKKLQCLKQLSSLVDYPKCKDFEHLKSYR